jgi:hypothetical protein
LPVNADRASARMTVRLKTGTAPTEWVIGGTIPSTENRIPLLPTRSTASSC